MRWRTTRGLRQGCPASPSLFIMIINDLLRKSFAMGFKIYAFADDLALKGSEKKELAGYAYMKAELEKLDRHY